MLKASVSAGHSGCVVGTGESAADQPAYGFSLGPESGVIGKGTGTDGIDHSAALPGAVVGKPDIRG